MEVELLLPAAFCWTKYGTESGEHPTLIIERKESERRSNRGVFLWGLGNSIRPSLRSLLDITDHPQVLFSPMLSAPSKRDASPTALFVWRHAREMNGRSYDLPPHSLVTSRVNDGERRPRHFALVCQSDEDLTKTGELASFDRSEVRNLRTGAIVGSSQVTSVVRFVRQSPAGRRYRVTFRAELIHPYLVELCAPVSVPDHLRPDRVEGSVREEAMHALVAARAY